MELDFTSDQEELRASVRSFLDTQCPLELVRSVVEGGEATSKLWFSMVALDWPALAVPEENGGLGLSFVETAVVVEELGRAVAPGPLLPTVTQFAPMVREIGTPEQRQRFLSEVASGALTGTVALADHARGWSLGDVTMIAERAEGGWVLDGTKLGVLAGEGMTEVVVVARAGDGVGAFVVPAAEARLTPVRSLDASRPLSTATLERVLLPDDRALGEPGSAASAQGATRALQEATAALALETVGVCDVLFQLVLSYVKDRKQFGVPIGSFQAVKHKMTNMFLAIERARSLVTSRSPPSTRTRRPGAPPSPWPRPPATTASARYAGTRSSPSVASGTPGSTTATSSSSGPSPAARSSGALPSTPSRWPPRWGPSPTERGRLAGCSRANG